MSHFMGILVVREQSSAGLMAARHRTQQQPPLPREWANDRKFLWKILVGRKMQGGAEIDRGWPMADPKHPEAMASPAAAVPGFRSIYIVSLALWSRERQRAESGSHSGEQLLESEKTVFCLYAF